MGSEQEQWQSKNTLTMGPERVCCGAEAGPLGTGVSMEGHLKGRCGRVNGDPRNKWDSWSSVYQYLQCQWAHRHTQ